MLLKTSLPVAVLRLKTIIWEESAEVHSVYNTINISGEHIGKYIFFVCIQLLLLLEFYILMEVKSCEKLPIVAKNNAFFVTTNIVFFEVPDFKLVDLH